MILKTINSGANWSTVNSGALNDDLTGMDFMDASNGFIVGGNSSFNTGLILQTNNGGNSWYSYSPGTSRLTRVVFVNSNTGYAVGLDGTILKYTSDVSVPEVGSGYSKFNSYPNPFSSITTIDCGNYIFEHNPIVKVFDLEGRLFANKESSIKENKIVVERNNLTSGIYIYKVYNGQTMIGTGKLVVQ